MKKRETENDALREKINEMGSEAEGLRRDISEYEKI